jgi:hypothetical protein
MAASKSPVRPSCRKNSRCPAPRGVVPVGFGHKLAELLQANIAYEMAWVA